jgi:hypothetical protein
MVSLDAAQDTTILCILIGHLGESVDEERLVSSDGHRVTYRNVEQ